MTNTTASNSVRIDYEVVSGARARKISAKARHGLKDIAQCLANELLEAGNVKDKIDRLEGFWCVGGWENEYGVTCNSWHEYIDDICACNGWSNSVEAGMDAQKVFDVFVEDVNDALEVLLGLYDIVDMDWMLDNA